MGKPITQLTTANGFMVEQKKKNIRLVVKIKDIKLLGFQVTENGNNLKEPIHDEKYLVEFMVSSNLNKESKTFETNLLVKLGDNGSSIQPVPELATMRVRFDLSIKNFDEIVIQEDNHVRLPDDLIKMALSTTIGAARGMFVLCVSPYKFSNAIIPLINIDDLFKSMQVQKTS